MRPSGKRVLVLGGSLLQVPLIERARSLGHEVGVLDRDPEAVGAKLADQFYEVSTTDAPGVLAAALDFRADAVVTAATDMPMRALSHACAALRLRGPSEESAFMATDKVAMHLALRSADVPVPDSVLVRDMADLEAAFDLGFPFVLKPADSSGSRGVSVVEERSRADDSLQYARSASDSGSVLAQEYLIGREISVEGLCVGDQPYVVTVTDKITSGAPHFVELGHSQPSSIEGAVWSEVEDVACRAARALGLSDCAMHVEMMITDEGPKVIELGARLGGDFITSHLVPLSTGVDMVGALISITLGEDAALDQTVERGSAVMFLRVPARQGDSTETAALGGMVQLVVDRESKPRELRSSTDRFGHAIAEGDTASDALLTAQAAVRELEQEAK